ncbi:hypothetical protein [Calothrix sp. NIES-3974]|uniref:hypothetical protein n=1 Tax=Calothrix sp. NIES-3974 TaxID=2005462 RepID=UPI000B5FCBAA|nr:hypothetical protein NIES3974_19800 [Calothrix sp. NIES-3974]
MQKKVSNSRTSIYRWIFGISTIITTMQPLNSQVVQASEVAALKPSDAPLELELLTNPGNKVVTANTINQAKITVPSLWWSKEKYGNKLLANWIAYPGNQNQAGRIDVIVNQQVWSILDYLERYNFINQLGTIARNSCSQEATDSALGENKICNQGYNLRVFNYQQDFLGAYTCDFSSPANTRCGIDMRGGNRLKFNPNQVSLYR